MPIIRQEPQNFVNFTLYDVSVFCLSHNYINVACIFRKRLSRLCPEKENNKAIKPIWNINLRTLNGEARKHGSAVHKSISTASSLSEYTLPDRILNLKNISQWDICVPENSKYQLKTCIRQCIRHQI